MLVSGGYTLIPEEPLSRDIVLHCFFAWLRTDVRQDYEDSIEPVEYSTTVPRLLELSERLAGSLNTDKAIPKL